jgi:hypothetical protein
LHPIARPRDRFGRVREGPSVPATAFTFARLSSRNRKARTAASARRRKRSGLGLSCGANMCSYSRRAGGRNGRTCVRIRLNPWARREQARNAPGAATRLAGWGNRQSYLPLGIRGAAAPEQARGDPGANEHEWMTGRLARASAGRFSLRVQPQAPTRACAPNAQGKRSPVRRPQRAPNARGWGLLPTINRPAGAARLGWTPEPFCGRHNP